MLSNRVWLVCCVRANARRTVRARCALEALIARGGRCGAEYPRRRTAHVGKGAQVELFGRNGGWLQIASDNWVQIAKLTRIIVAEDTGAPVGARSRPHLERAAAYRAAQAPRSARPALPTSNGDQAAGVVWRWRPK